MQYQSTVFGQLLKALPRSRFERLAKRHVEGRKKRELGSWSHLVAMVFAQAGGARSLRDLERLLERHHGVAAHLGLGQVKRSTLADANRLRSADLFCDVAQLLAGDLAHGRGASEAVHLIDATRILAGKRMEHWAAGGGVKLHVMYEATGAHPVCFAVTPDRVNDITAAHAMPIAPGATYVFDKGYYHFAFWAKLDAQGCRFVTRLKTNSPATVISERPVESGSSIRFDRVVTLSERLKTMRLNPLSRPLRLINVTISTGREITLVSNDLDSPAAVIAGLYKARWQVELFFKWIKQNLKISHFMGTSRNAVTIQIMTALIAFMLLRIAQKKANAALGLQAIARLIQPLALVRRPITELFFPIPSPIEKPSDQLSWDFNHA
jgi:transposase